MRLWRRKGDRLHKVSALAESEQYTNILPEEVEDMLNEIKERGVPKAYFCELSLFRQIYHLEMRSREESQTPLFVISMAIVDEFGNVPDNLILPDLSEKLKTILRENLRNGDVVTDYSDYQLLLILPDASEKDCSNIILRLQREFLQKVPNGIYLKCGYETL